MMTTTTSSPAAGSAPFIADAWRIVRSLAARLNGWLEARQRAFDDGSTLAQLSDRDLHDIGLDRGFVDAVARGRWTREGPDL